MGLSASQTRFLSLTAKKSNVEFQGQQINQARTALANQSSELFTQMMNLQAPTAPSVYKYVIDPATNPNINWSNPDAYPLDTEGMKNFSIYYAGNQPAFQDFNIPEYVYRTTTNADGTETTGWCKKTTDESGNVSYGVPIENKEDIQGTYCYKDTGIDAAGNEISFYNITVSEAENYTYDKSTGMFTPNDGVSEYELPKWIQAYNLAASQYNTYSQPKKTEIYSQGTDLELVNDNIASNDPTPIGYKSSSTININQAQYNAAMVQYEQDLKEYEEALDIINAKTEEIHEADKKLELQLKQLDTEQEAIQTEYEALKKVIDKNIENTFKSFA